MAENKVEYLIVDTSAFIQNVALQEIGKNIITEKSVIAEITNKRQLKRLVVLPYDLAVKDVFTENIKFVTEFAKKTGDYMSLSATDIRVIALTYQLEKERVGTAHLKESPSVAKTINPADAQPLAHPKSIAGFYLPEHDDESDDGHDSEVEYEEEIEIEKNIPNEKQSNAPQEKQNNQDDNQSEHEEDPEFDYLKTVTDDDLSSKFKNLNCNVEDLELEGNGKHKVDDILAPVKDEYGEDSGEGGSEEEDEDSDGGGWITPSNLAQAKKSMDSGILADKPVTVACMTTDFAMQNVLMQIGLNVAALDGRVIKQMRTFIFRCYACFKTTSIMTKVFCPSCGLKTLKKVAVSVDDEGKQQIHINFRRPLSAKGKKFSLPTPRGGKHAVNPILCEDQPVPQQKPSQKALLRNDPLHEDYTAGYSPFVMRDVGSKSAMRGFCPQGGSFKYWMKKNPNERQRKRK